MIKNETKNSDVVETLVEPVKPRKSKSKTASWAPLLVFVAFLVGMLVMTLVQAQRPQNLGSDASTDDVCIQYASNRQACVTSGCRFIAARRANCSAFTTRATCRAKQGCIPSGRGASFECTGQYIRTVSQCVRRIAPSTTPITTPSPATTTPTITPLPATPTAAIPPLFSMTGTTSCGTGPTDITARVVWERPTGAVEYDVYLCAGNSCNPKSSNPTSTRDLSFSTFFASSSTLRFQVEAFSNSGQYLGRTDVVTLQKPTNCVPSPTPTVFIPPTDTFPPQASLRMKHGSSFSIQDMISSQDYRTIIVTVKGDQAAGPSDIVVYRYDPDVPFGLMMEEASVAHSMTCENTYGNWVEIARKNGVTLNNSGNQTLYLHWSVSDLQSLVGNMANMGQFMNKKHMIAVNVVSQNWRTIGLDDSVCTGSPALNEETGKACFSQNWCNGTNNRLTPGMYRLVSIYP